jgi:hypothetical protein
VLILNAQGIYSQIGIRRVTGTMAQLLAVNGLLSRQIGPGSVIGRSRASGTVTVCVPAVKTTRPTVVCPALTPTGWESITLVTGVSLHSKTVAPLVATALDSEFHRVLKVANGSPFVVSVTSWNPLFTLLNRALTEASTA